MIPEIRLFLGTGPIVELFIKTPGNFISQKPLFGPPFANPEGPFPAQVAKNRTLLHTFSKNAHSALFTPNGAFCLALSNANGRYWEAKLKGAG